MSIKIVVMGVAGCGKSTLGAEMARVLSCELIEGDDHHPQSNRDKMSAGIALGDADRWPWLAGLARILQSSPRNAVLTCSALKRRYRDLLRGCVPGLKFIFLDIRPEHAAERVASRPGHLFPASLVASQFAALEPPIGEEDVLSVDASLTIGEQVRCVFTWLAHCKKHHTIEHEHSQEL